MTSTLISYVAVGWKLTELTAAPPSPRSATGTTGGAAILARSRLRIDSSLDVLSGAQTVEDHEPIDVAAAIAHGCHSRILLVTLLPHGLSGRQCAQSHEARTSWSARTHHAPSICDCVRF